MTIPIPRLDDRDYEQLRAEAIDFVRRRDATWNELGDGDPGTVLLEAFAYLTDVLLYRLNRVPEKARREFLGLLGVTLAPPGAASTRLSFRSAGRPGDEVVTVPAGTVVTASDGGRSAPIEFVTDAPVDVDPDGSDAIVEAHHCRQVSAERIGISTGEPGQTFVLSEAPVVAPTGHELDLVIGVEASPDELEARPEAIRHGSMAFAIWPIVSSFAGSSGDTSAVRVDRATGLVTFAPAIRDRNDDGSLAATVTSLAAVPPAGREIRAWYRVGGGAAGNVAAGTLTTIVSPDLDGVEVSNPTRASGGGDRESIDHAVRRGHESILEPRRAVTADDFETLACRDPGVTRARAIAESDYWVHADAGRVEVRLVPDVGARAQVPSASELIDAQQPGLLDRVAGALERDQPLGMRSVVRWTPYKEVSVHLRVVVSRSEDPAAVGRRVEDRLRRTLSPTAVRGHPDGWPFGQALRASNVYNAVLAEPGVRYADAIEMEVSECPDTEIGDVVADRHQPDLWYVATGARLFRSENGGLGWELVHRVDDGDIERIVPAPDRPGHVAIIVNGVASSSSRLLVSTDCGTTWPDEPAVAFTWQTEDRAHEIHDVAWTPAGHDDDLLVATDRGLYRVRFAEAIPRPWIVDPSTPEAGCWSVAAVATVDGGLEVAVALQRRGGVWLLGPDADASFRSVGLIGTDVRRLIVERRNIRRFLWAPAFAVGDDPGTGCHRAELRGDERPIDWVALDTGWNGGICHDLAFLEDRVLAASEFNGVLALDRSATEPAWRSPSVQQSGLPLLESRRFQPVRAIDAAGTVALAGTGRSVFRTDGGARFSDVARRRVGDIVTLPASWLFASGAHHVVVETEGP